MSRKAAWNAPGGAIAIHELKLLCYWYIREQDCRVVLFKRAQMRISRMIVAWTLLFGSILLVAQDDVETRGAEIAQSLVKRYVAWQTRVSSPGASIEAKEVARRGSLVQYHLYVTGLPSDSLYAVVQWPVTQRDPSTQIEGVSLGKDGLVMCAGRTEEQCGDPATKDDPIEFTFNYTH
jgi:hypothetical protein